MSNRKLTTLELFRACGANLEVVDQRFRDDKLVAASLKLHHFYAEPRQPLLVDDEAKQMLKLEDKMALRPSDVNLADLPPIPVPECDLFQLVPFRTEAPANFVRITPIGTIDAELLYGDYNVIDVSRDQNFVPSAWQGRWYGDNFLVHLEHVEHKTRHCVRGFRVRYSGVLQGATRITLNSFDSFATRT